MVLFINNFLTIYYFMRIISLYPKTNYLFQRMKCNVLYIIFILEVVQKLDTEYRT